VHVTSSKHKQQDRLSLQTSDQRMAASHKLDHQQRSKRQRIEAESLSTYGLAVAKPSVLAQAPAATHPAIEMAQSQANSMPPRLLQQMVVPPLPFTVQFRRSASLRLLLET
jgi:hypothetical protein